MTENQTDKGLASRVEGVEVEARVAVTASGEKRWKTTSRDHANQCLLMVCPDCGSGAQLAERQRPDFREKKSWPCISCGEELRLPDPFNVAADLGEPEPRDLELEHEQVMRDFLTLTATRGQSQDGNATTTRDPNPELPNTENGGEDGPATPDKEGGAE
jgi:hypothetical protein